MIQVNKLCLHKRMNETTEINPISRKAAIFVTNPIIMIPTVSENKGKSEKETKILFPISIDERNQHSISLSISKTNSSK